MIDFAVVGGGIAGISVAARLSEFGRTELFEGEEGLGYHASGRSAALFEAGYGAPATLALNRASQDYHETAEGGVLSPRGLMVVAAADAAADFERDVATMHLDEISLDEAAALMPILDTGRLARAAFHAEAWDLDVDRLIQHFARALRANGGAVHTRAAITAASRTATGWRLQTGAGEFEARVLVNAAGAWADQVAKIAGITPIGLTPCRRSMARIPAPGGHDVSGWPMTIGAGETWYAKPDAGALLVSPADADPVDPHDAWADDMVIAEGLARYEACVTEPVTRVLTTWAGLRTFAPDRVPVLGPEPDDPAFVWVAGQGGSGIQSSPAASQLVADLVAGRPGTLEPATVAALSPARFR